MSPFITPPKPIEGGRLKIIFCADTQCPGCGTWRSFPTGTPLNPAVDEIMAWPGEDDDWYGRGEFCPECRARVDIHADPVEDEVMEDDES